jgi:hypothetical protein
MIILIAQNERKMKKEKRRKEEGRIYIGETRAGQGHVVPSVRGHGGRGNEWTSIRKKKLSNQCKKVTVTYKTYFLPFYLLFFLL